MPKQSVILAALIVSSAIVSCRGPEGPVGPEGPPGSGGAGSLIDPAIQPKVIYTFPPANTQGPYEYFSEQYNQIQFRFNKIMDRGSIHDAVHLSSPNTRIHVDTTFIYSLGDDLWIVYPVDSPGYYYSVRWRIAETYTFSISSIAKDVNGNTLAPPFSMTFTPEPFFRIKQVYPPPGLSDVRTDASMWIYFNNAVDTSTFSRIHITPPISGRWFYAYWDSTQIRFSSAPLSNNTTYTIRVDAAARDVDGHSLQEDFVYSFSTIGFRVWYSYPPDGGRNIPPSNWISVTFTAPIDSGTVRSAFSISPNLPGTLYPWNSGQNNFLFAPSSQMQSEASYTVTIDSSLRSIAGVNLPSRYQFSFTTAPFAVTSTYPGDGWTGVYRGTNIVVYCNAYIDSSTIRSSFTLKDSTGASVGGTINAYPRETSFWFSLASPLAPNAWYTGTISTGLRALGGSPLKSQYTFSFRTGN